MISDMYSMYTIRIASYHYRAYNLVRSLLHTNIMATPSDKCTPCELCHKSNPKTKHLGQMEKHVHHNVVYRWLKLNKQHTSAFRSQTPEALFYSICDTNTVYEHHAKWLAMIRSTVRQRVDTESKSIPSTEALLLHWKRCTWVVAMWHCATLNHINLPGNLHVHALYRRTCTCTCTFTCTCNIYCDTLYLLHSINRVWMDEKEWQTRDNLGSV